jgi:hypothetical protein
MECMVMLATPLLSRGGVDATSRKCCEASREAQARQRAASGIDGAGGVVLVQPPINRKLNQPPRPRQLRMLRDILLMAWPPLLGQGGEPLASLSSQKMAKLRGRS